MIPTIKTVTIEADFITLNALNAYLDECGEQIRKARNVDEARFWESQKLAATKQRNALRAELIKDEGNFNF